MACIILWGVRKRNKFILTTDPPKITAADTLSAGKAKLRLETALTGLEEVLEDKLAEGLHADNSFENLNNANQQIADLKLQNKSIAARLDVAIKKLIDILSE